MFYQKLQHEIVRIKQIIPYAKALIQNFTPEKHFAYRGGALSRAHEQQRLGAKKQPSVPCILRQPWVKGDLMVNLQ